MTFESEVSPSLTRHTSGVSGWDQSVTVDDEYDWDKSHKLELCDAALRKDLQKRKRLDADQQVL